MKEKRTLEIPAAAFRKKIAERRGNIPAALGLQNLNEPVCFYQTFATKASVPEIVDHMERAGYKCAAAYDFDNVYGNQGIKYFTLYKIIC